MDINNKVDHMDEELQLLKNEIKQVLLEIQEHVLNVQNPFSGGGPGKNDNYAASKPAPPEPVFTEPLIPEPVAPTPAPAPAAATEINVTTETAAPVAAAPAPAPAPVAPVGEYVPSMPAPPAYAPPANMGGYSGPAYAPPPMPAMPSMPFIPPSGGSGYSGPPPDSGDRDRYRNMERELDRDRKRSQDRDSETHENRSFEGRMERPFNADIPYLSDDEGRSFEDADAVSFKRDGDSSPGSPREFADIMASLKDEVGMPGLPPTVSSGKASGGDKQRKPGSGDVEGGSLRPPGMVFNLPGLNLDGKAVDLVTTAGLIQWSYSILEKVGTDNLFSILEVSALTGRIPQETRDILLSVIPIFEMAGKAENVTVKEIIATLAELDGFLGNISPEDTRLLPFLLQEEMDVFPLIRPR